MWTKEELIDFQEDLVVITSYLQTIYPKKAVKNLNSPPLGKSPKVLPTLSSSSAEVRYKKD